MVLVNAMGMQPRSGEILDQFLINTIDYIRSGFADQDNYAELYSAEPTLDQLEQWEINREMTSRIAYKPYMFDQTTAASDSRRAHADAGRVGQGESDRAARVCASIIATRSPARGWKRSRARVISSKSRSRPSWRGWCAIFAGGARKRVRAPREQPGTVQNNRRESAMHLMYFTEQPMSAYPEEEGKKFGYTALVFPNKYLRSGRGQPASTRSASSSISSPKSRASTGSCSTSITTRRSACRPSATSWPRSSLR